MSEPCKDADCMTREDLERIKEAQRKKPGFTGEFSDFVIRAERAVQRREAEAKKKGVPK